MYKFYFKISIPLRFNYNQMLAHYGVNVAEFQFH